MTDPATGAKLGTVPNMGADETRRAIVAANKAWPTWRAKTGKERSAILRRWFDLIMANQDDLARLMTMEQGKPLAESMGEIVYGGGFVEWFAEEAKRVYGDIIPERDDHAQMYAGPCDRLPRRHQARILHADFGTRLGRIG